MIVSNLNQVFEINRKATARVLVCVNYLCFSPLPFQQLISCQLGTNGYVNSLLYGQEIR